MPITIEIPDEMLEDDLVREATEELIRRIGECRVPERKEARDA